MFVEQSYFQGQLCYALNIDVKIFQLCIPIWLCGLDRTIELVVNLLWHWGTTSCASKQSNIEIRTQINSSLLLDLPKSNQIALWGKFTLKNRHFYTARQPFIPGNDVLSHKGWYLMCALFVSVYLEVYGRYFHAGSTVVSWTIEHIGIALAQWWKDNPLKGAASCILLIDDVKSNTVQP